MLNDREIDILLLEEYKGYSEETNEEILLKKLLIEMVEERLTTDYVENIW